MNDKKLENADSQKYEMQKRRELMADGRRYIIYYTFGETTGKGLLESEISVTRGKEQKV